MLLMIFVFWLAWRLLRLAVVAALWLLLGAVWALILAARVVAWCWRKYRQHRQRQTQARR